MKYYIRNKSAGFLGNSPMWWKIGNCGYTAYILGAKKFTKEMATKIVNGDPDKFEMLNVNHVNNRLHLIYDSQDDRRLGTDEGCGWYKYARNPDSDEEFLAGFLNWHQSENIGLDVDPIERAKEYLKLCKSE